MNEDTMLTAKNENGRIIKSALVTGASGMIGATLSRLLLKNGVRVFAMVRPGSKKLGNLPAGEKNLVIIERDIADEQPLVLPENVDAVFHFAWNGTFGGSRNEREGQQKNIDCMLKLLRGVKKYGAKVFIGAGSQAEFGPHDEPLTEETPCFPVTEYGKAKLEAGRKGAETAKTLGIDFIWTRILSVYGPYDNGHSMVMSAVNTFLRGEHFSCTKGEQVWDYLYAGDAAEIFWRLALNGKDGETYVVSSGHTSLLREYIETIRDEVSPGVSIGFGEKPYYEHQVMHLSGNMTKTINTTGFVPGTSFADGIRETIAWAREQESAKNA